MFNITSEYFSFFNNALLLLAVHNVILIRVELGGLGEWVYLKREQRPRDIPYLLLTSQPYFLVVSTGNLY